jgi:large subunit ribosomal protein L28e
MAAKVTHDAPALPLASADLVWQVTRNHNSFTRGGRTNTGVLFTAEPHNLVNINRRKFSGLGQAKTVGVEIRRGARKGEILGLNKSESNTPARNTTKTHLRINNKRSFVVTRSKLSTHRPDLTRAALVRVARIANAERAVLKAAKAAPAKKE